jgi:osmotically-inducible protein OsmY
VTTRQQTKDLQITAAVERELAWLPSVDSTRIAVSVRDGAVTLSGEVDTYPEKVLAGKAAQRVQGVIGLALEITVNHEWAAATDADIARESAEALLRAIDVPRSVKAGVAHHVVTLSGEVQWQFQREAAIRTVQYLKGVVVVQDATTLRATVASVGLKTSIREALVRNAQLESDQIGVTAHAGGGVTLTGTVGSWAESRQAEHACWAAPGVTAVHNQLTLQY